MALDVTRAPATGPPEAPPAATGEAVRPGRGVLNAFSHVFLVLWAVLTTFPLLWAVVQAFRSDADILTDPWGLPLHPELGNWARAWNEAHIGRYTLNTVIVLAFSLTFTMLFGAMAAYVLARYPFPGNRVIYYAFIGGLAFPHFLAFVPLFFVVDNVGSLPLVGQFIGLDSYGGLVLVYIAYSLPFTVFFLTAFFRTLPTSIAEAALIDGCSHFGMFFRVMLPMAKPGLLSVAIFNLLGQWNQFLFPFVLIHDQDKQVLAQGIQSLTVHEGFTGHWGALFAGLTIAMLPVLVVYVVFQRQVQAGLSAGALK